MSEPDYEYDGDWVECWSCGGEGFREDCFEDTCGCLNPPCLQQRCDICLGKGGWKADSPTTEDQD